MKQPVSIAFVVAWTFGILSGVRPLLGQVTSKVNVEEPGRLVQVPEEVTIRVRPPVTPTLSYAADRIAAELSSLYHLRATVADAAAAGSDARNLIELGRADQATGPRDHSARVPMPAMPDGRNAYSVSVHTEPWQVTILGHDDVGAWYGACAWLDSLVDRPDGSILTPTGPIAGQPALPIRFTRGIRAGDAKTLEEAIPSLDFWARWRMNVTRMDSPDEAFLRAFFEAAHLRGIRVLKGLGVRNLCAADDERVAEKAREFRRFLELGGDGVCVLWDDLAHERCYGHCDRCRERFGPDSLPAEIVHVVEAFCDVAAAAPAGRDPLIIWCPSHYSARRYPEMSDETFYRVIGTSAKVREQTHLFYCEYRPSETQLLDRFGLTRRIWWYNGIRCLYNNCSRWPASPELSLKIPDLKSFPEPDFAPFDWGWKMGVGVNADGQIVLPSEDTWEALRTVPERFDGFYPCMPTTPYHAAMSAVYAMAPADFDQARADRLVFRAMFGPGSAPAARRWSDLYTSLQVQIARATSGATPADDARERIATTLREWRETRDHVASLAGRGRTLLDPPTLRSVLDQMHHAEQNVEALIEKHF